METPFSFYTSYMNICKPHIKKTSFLNAPFHLQTKKLPSGGPASASSAYFRHRGDRTPPTVPCALRESFPFMLLTFSSFQEEISTSAYGWEHRGSEEVSSMAKLTQARLVNWAGWDSHPLRTDSPARPCSFHYIARPPVPLYPLKGVLCTQGALRACFFLKLPLRRICLISWSLAGRSCTGAGTARSFICIESYHRQSNLLFFFFSVSMATLLCT